jgi:hypothetical protein
VPALSSASALDLIKAGKYNQVLQVASLPPTTSCIQHLVVNSVQEVGCLQALEEETLRVAAEPNDCSYTMGQRRLYLLYVMDAVCIGGSSSSSSSSSSDAKMPSAAYQHIVDILSPRLPQFVGRLATPCNCEKVRHQAVCD